jgi:hypothetical protein
MADQSLQAFQLGASLFDRAQTQKRMMEQFNLQLADQAMRKEHYDIQNKIATDNAKRTLDEQNAFNQDLPLIQDWQSQFLRWNAAGKPNEPFPAPPTNLKSATGLKMLGDMSGPVLQSLPMMRNQALGRTAYEKEMESLNNEIKFLTENGKSDVVLKYNRGINPETNQIDLNARDEIFNAAKPLREQESRLKRLAAIGMAGQRNTKEGLKTLLDSGEITPQEYEQLLPTARTEGGVAEQRTQKNIKDLVDEGLLDPNNKADVATASRAIRSNLKTPTKIVDSVTAADSATYQLDNAFQKINAFNSKYGANAFNEYVGPVDEPLFRAEGKFKGLTSAEKQTARTIQQQIAQVVQDYRRGVFGQTLQPNEQKNMDEIVGTTRGNDYLVLVGGFNDNLKSGLKRTISNYKFNADIPIDIKRTHAPEIFVSGQVQDRQPAAAPEQPISPQDVFKNIRANRPQGGTIQPTTPPASNRVGRFEMFIEGQ